MSHLSSEGGTYPAPVIHEFAPVARELLACDARNTFLTGDGRDVVKAALDAAIKEHAPRVLSFDVFDTFLLRNDKAEAKRYLELSEELRARIDQTLSQGQRLPSHLDLLLARVDALRLSYRLAPAVEGCREGNIRQVIRLARCALGLASDAEGLMLDCELDYEAANLTLNRALLACAENFRASGGRVILISDMYLGRAEIEEIIRRIDDRALTTIDAIFSSADHAVNKASGKMFKFVEKEFDLPPSAFLHIGDGWQNDIQRCREAGWSTLHFPVSRAELARREDSLALLHADLARTGLDSRSWAKL